MECFPLPRHALAAALPLLLLAVATAACSGTVVAADGGSKQALESTGSLLATTVGGGEERPPRRLSESESEELVLEVRMPGVTTDSMDEYHCVNVELPDEPLNLVEIESLSDQGLVHHMLLWGETAGAAVSAPWLPWRAVASGSGEGRELGSKILPAGHK